jgi:hypothetical protein
MIDQIKDTVAKLHNKHISEFTKQIHQLFHGIVRTPEDDGENTSNRVIDGNPGHDKITGFRNNLGTIPNSNQPELARLINDRTSEFEQELRKTPSINEIDIRTELQRFKEELMSIIYSGVQ